MTAADYTRVGAFNIDGKWATAIRFEATIAAQEVAQRPAAIHERPQRTGGSRSGGR